MAFGRGAKLEVVVAGDTRQLDRALTRSETRLKKFGKNVNTAGGAAGIRGGGLVGLGAKGNVAVAGAAAAALSIRSIAKAAGEAEVVLGQTSVAVRQAGIDWGLTGRQIEAGADRISKASAFDDEDVLKSFGVFVRGQKDVGKSMELSALAADVARGRYTDLSSATQLVNKAAMGQIGALRRAGIQIDKNATSTQALEALQRAYAGSAKKYSESAAGGMDKLKVAWENLLESVGEGAAPASGGLTGFLTGVVEWTDKAFTSTSRYYQKLLEVQRQLGMPGISAPARDTSTSIGNRPEEGTASASAAALAGRGRGGGQPKLITQIPNRLIAEAQRAELAGNTAALRAVLVKEKGVLQSALKQKGLKPGQVVALQADLLSVADAIRAIDEQVAADADAKVQAANDAKTKMKAASAAAVAALQAQGQAFKDQAAEIKSAVLDKFSLRESKLDVSRGLEDANKALRTARMIGAPSGIQAATRQLEDARLAADRLKWEQTQFSVGAGPPGPKSSLTVGGITIVINGAANPETIATQVIAAISKRSKQTAGQSRGRSSGNPMHR